MKVRKVKQNKFIYYLRNIFIQLIPKSIYESALRKKLNAASDFNKAALSDRVNYYNKLDRFTPLADNIPAIKDLNFLKRPREYHFDAFAYVRYFDRKFKASFIFGDVTHIEATPTIQKSRPVAGDNANAVLLKLNRTRHFVFVKDKKKYSSKKNILIGRSSVFQKNRVRFMEMYFDHPLCDLGQINKTGGNLKWLKPKISIAAHLDYKFILSLEGNDVATNLKWIMSSNSIAVMPKPNHETWFMEGRLVPDFHYIMIKDDFTDLEEKLNYYIDNEAVAQKIINNANEYVQQFLNKKQEEMISLLVLNKYFYYTGQMDEYELL